MAEYVELLAKVYDRYWGPYPRRIGAQMLRLHATLAPDAEQRVLDIGCGTGIVAERFVAEGYAVTGLDRSPGMLARARERLGDKAVLLEGDATDFTVGERFPFAMSTYDIVNHLGGEERVRSYFRCVRRALVPGAWFGFDMVTWEGLRTMHVVQVRDEEPALLVIRGALHEEEGVGYLRISGAVRAEDGRYDRFGTTITNHAFTVEQMCAMAVEAGFAIEHLAAPDDALTPVTEPEALTRLLVVTRAV